MWEFILFVDWKWDGPCCEQWVGCLRSAGTAALIHEHNATREPGTSPNFIGQQLQLWTYLHEAFLSACCVQVVITVPGRVLSAFKTVSSSSSSSTSVWLLEAPAVCWSCSKVGYWKVACSHVALVCTSTRKYDILALGVKIHPSVLEPLLNVESICVHIVKGFSVISERIHLLPG